MSSPLDTEFHRRIARRLDEELDRLTMSLRSGVLDHLEYKRVCGYIKGLSDVQDWCGEIEHNINQGK